MEDFSFFSNNTIGGDIITFKYRYRKQILIGILISIITIGLSTYFFFSNNQEEKDEEPIVIEKKLKKKESNLKKVEEVKVDIKGAINSPGIYSLDTDSRVIDVIEKAGGLTENADTTVMNLSKKISDEMVIIVYTKEEVKNFETTKEKEALIQDKCNQKDENALKNDACIETSSNESTSTTSKKVSLNNATKEELMTLPGIGEAKAKDIISYRDKNGPFKSIDDITKVNGIGENILAQIKENLTL